MVEGLLPDTATSAMHVLDAAVEQYQATIEESIPKIVQGALKEMLSTYIASFSKSSNCPSPPKSTHSMDLVQKELMEVDPVMGELSLNDKII